MTTYTSFSQVQTLTKGALFVCPTDTVYGLSCLATDADAVENLKKLKGKGKEMPVIVLIANLTQLDMFVDKANASRRIAEERILRAVWPGPVSIIFTETVPEWSAISPDQTLAVRMPNRKDLRAFVERVGPIISTSANLHGQPLATTAAEALAYFPTQLEFIVDMGVCNNPPSTLIKIIR